MGRSKQVSISLTVRCPLISVTHSHHISRLASLFQLFQNSLNWMGGCQNSAVIANYEGTRIRTRWNVLLYGARQECAYVCVRESPHNSSHGERRGACYRRHWTDAWRHTLPTFPPPPLLCCRQTAVITHRYHLVPATITILSLDLSRDPLLTFTLLAWWDLAVIMVFYLIKSLTRIVWKSFQFFPHFQYLQLFSNSCIPAQLHFMVYLPKL